MVGNRRSRVIGYGTLAARPAATLAGVHIGDEYVEQATGDLYKVVGTGAPGSITKSWALISEGGEGTYYAGGEDTLAAGTKQVGPGTFRLTATSRIEVTAKGATGFAIGRLDVASRTVGAAGTAKFTVTSKKPADGTTETNDLSSFDWTITDSDTG